ncbi:MAG: prolyl oligopeptidase family serine peptidase [Planctomycetota bacterium]|nr:prolyl oligopeptidase family serine peptidase [Planctomycetota bacterium]MDA1213639.1 prolyl oligopeptidase family serine peptidase [Planctomycetota bacterium]
MVRTMLVVLVCTLTANFASSAEWPSLPDENAAVQIPAQEWPLRPGERTVRVLVHYPHGRLENVTAETGLMLTLHNWGGTDCVGTAAPQVLADRLNVVAICVNYVQSGKEDSINGPEPYDFGYLQGLDALRALWWVRDRLIDSGREFDDGRIYSTGGSGGGNVTQMVNKLAPRTFTCVIDMCGMKKLSDDIAFNLPGGSALDARWSRDPKHPYYLSPGHQELRFVGCPEHLWTQKRIGATAKIIVVHGVDDSTCPFADAEEMVRLMQGHGIDVVPHFITKGDLDGTVFTSTGHSLGNRTEIVFRVAEKFLRPTSDDFLHRETPTDFERQGDVRYRTSDGEFVISYAAGYPVGRFEPKSPATPYADHVNLDMVIADDGTSQKISTSADWQRRVKQIRSNFEQAAGPLPGPEFRVPLDVRIEETTKVDGLTRIKLSYQSDPFDRVPAYLFLPETTTPHGTPAMLCLQQTFGGGKSEPAGLAGDPRLHYALELAKRGYVTLAPDYPSFGEHAYDFGEKSPYASGTMKAIWDNLRAVDQLEGRPEVDVSRIGVIGHSLGGHNSIFTALFDERLQVVVSSCGFCRFGKDDIPSWTGPRYMPLIASQFDNDINKVPFDFPELIAAIAPRAFFSSAATKDSDFDVEGVRETIAAVQPIFELMESDKKLQAYYPEIEHAFPDDAREKAYRFIDEQLK